MSTEFEWRNEMRKLGGAVAPQNDLWPGIAARIAVAQNPPKRSRTPRLVFALAASVLAAVGAGVIGTHFLHAPTGPVATAPNDATVATNTPDSNDKPRTALDWAQPANPKLALAAQDLDAASAQLQDALEKRPDAVFLVGLLNRTNSQRVRLMRQAPYAG
ncbi:MAG TPA: hypothetical protein VF132_07740 [Rudaea sp.]